MLTGAYVIWWTALPHRQYFCIITILLPNKMGFSPVVCPTISRLGTQAPTAFPLCPVEGTLPRPVFWTLRRPGTTTDQETSPCGPPTWRWERAPQKYTRVLSLLWFCQLYSGEIAEFHQLFSELGTSLAITDEAYYKSTVLSTSLSLNPPLPVFPSPRTEVRWTCVVWARHCPPTWWRRGWWYSSSRWRRSSAGWSRRSASW